MTALGIPAIFRQVVTADTGESKFTASRLAPQEHSLRASFVTIGENII
jgi:hypothetical protein